MLAPGTLEGVVLVLLENNGRLENNDIKVDECSQLSVLHQRKISKLTLQLRTSLLTTVNTSRAQVCLVDVLISFIISFITFR